MKRSAPILIVLLVLVPALWGQVTPPGEKPAPRAAVRTKEPEPNIWVSFVPVPRGAPVSMAAGGQGTLDLGRISFFGGATNDGVTVVRRGKSFVVSTIFGLRVGSEASTGTAKLIGLLTQMNANYRISVDGVRLALTPQVIQMAVKYGAVTEHRLDIEVPADNPEVAAQLFQSVAFQVLAN